MSIKHEPEYTCEYCGTYIAKEDIRHTYTPRDNSRPAYFCSIGCYYGWSSEGETPYSDHNYED